MSLYVTICCISKASYHTLIGTGSAENSTNVIGLVPTKSPGEELLWNGFNQLLMAK